MPFRFSAIERTWRRVFLHSVAERWGDTGPEGTQDSMRMGDRTQTTSVAYLIPWIRIRRRWQGLEGIFYETTPECCSAVGSCLWVMCHFERW